MAESTQRAENATPAPWQAFKEDGVVITIAQVNELTGEVLKEGRIIAATPGWADEEAIVTEAEVANMDFVAAARTDMPARDAALLIAVKAIHPSECENTGDNGSTCDDRGDEPCDGCLNARTLAAILATLKGEAR